MGPDAIGMAGIARLVRGQEADTPDPPDTRPTAATVPAGPPPALPGRQGPLSGRTWAGYRIGDQIGQGGMGEVYCAVQDSVGRQVALKVLPAGAAEDRGRRLRFAAEARAAARIHSPHVVTVYDFGETDGRMWLAMELVGGTDLAEVIDARIADDDPFPPMEALELVIQAARGLAAVHAERLVHRDIKPGNLLMAGPGMLKIADFGLVRILDERSLTVTGAMLGTPLYLAPEQGRGAQADERSDIYSLGVVFYELLTMRPPFSGGTAEELISRHSFTEPELPSTINPDIPADVQAVCLKCLHKDPQRRFADADEMLADLERVRSGLAPVAARFDGGRMDTGAEEALRRLAGWRRRWWPALALAALLAVLAAAGWWWWDARKLALAAVRERLMPLAASGPVPTTAGQDLDALARLTGPDDPQVEQGRAKLGRIADARAGLAAALAADPPDPQQRRAIGAARDALAGEVGWEDPDVRRGRDRLAAAEARIAGLRTLLAGRCAGAPGLPAALAAGPELDELEHLAGAQDPDLAAWRTTVAGVLAAAAAERAALSRLDRVEALAPGERETLEAARGRLARLAGGRDDPDLARWAARLDALAGLADVPAAWLGLRMIDADTAGAGRAWLERWGALGGEAAPAQRWRARLQELCGPPAPAWAVDHGHDTHGPWLGLAVGRAGLRLRWLAPGTWPVGSAADEDGREPDEVPATVSTPGIWVADRECPQGLWEAVMGRNPARWRDPRAPVEQVSRHDAQAFCRRLAELLPGCRARLPYEAEWEAAVRAGIRGPWAGPDRGHAAAAVVHDGTGLGHPAPCAAGPANALGIHDGAGNVWEWADDDWGPAPGDGPATGRRSGSGDGVVRGGSWSDPLTACRPANRARLPADARSPYVGFRFAVEP